MLKDDWTECPHCTWPALYSVLIDFVSSGETPCPICNVVIDPKSLVLVKDPNLFAKLGDVTGGEV